MNEASIIINGVVLTNAEAMTVRVALNGFIMELSENGLGDDEHGKAMTKAYIEKAKNVLNIMHNK